MIIRKWNDESREYDFVEVPDEWKLPLYSEDMSEPINCVNCGCDMTYGDGYTSKRYHTAAGFGFYECEKCYYEYLPIYLDFKMKEAEEFAKRNDD